MRSRKDQAAAVGGEPAPAPELVAIEELFEKHQVPTWARAGLARKQGWAAGKRVAEPEFLRALATWRTAPVG